MVIIKTKLWSKTEHGLESWGIFNGYMTFDKLLNPLKPQFSLCD